MIYVGATVAEALNGRAFLNSFVWNPAISLLLKKGTM